MPSGKAGILFTSHHLILRNNFLRISPDEELAKMVKGQKYLGPVGWIKLFRQSVDRALPILYPKEVANIDNLTPDQYKALVQKAILDSCIDKYLPDVTTSTQFPDLRLAPNYNHEVVPFLGFDPRLYTRAVKLSCCFPDFPDEVIGGREALGTFLS